MNDQIESTLTENRIFKPVPSIRESANVNAAREAAMRAKAKADYEGYWADLARQHLRWKKPFNTVLDESRAPHYEWFSDGLLNVSYNCIDRHVENGQGERTAIIFEGEPGDTRHITFRQLLSEVCQLANVLKTQGINKGDRVIIYMPHLPEAVVAMQACARIGAIHSVVFGGFSAEALRDRTNDAAAKMIITVDAGHRGGKLVELKVAVDTAMSAGCPSVEKVLVFKRSGKDVVMGEHDIWWHEAIEGQSSECEPEWVEAEHPLFLLYTSGSTGKPKGIQHSSAGYLLQTLVTNIWVFDQQPQDVFWCTADVGWITGHSYVCYGPLANGTTQIMYEGGPTTPDAGRFWKICQDHGVTIFYTAPTAIRALMRLGDEIPQSYDLSKLRLLGTVGEPINPEAWIWYHKVIGVERCPIVDTWWQTETGAQMIAPLPGSTATKPGSCTRPLPGIMADIVDEKGAPVAVNSGGYLVIKKPWPSMLRTIWGDDERYRKTYWSMFGGKYYLAGDSARKDEDGYFWIMGRIDDVLNVSGHRIGTMEVESALVAHERVVEAAVVGRPHEIKGEAIVAFVICKGDRPLDNEADAIVKELREWVAKEIGPIAKPDEIRFAEGLPKTRSGKIMRRLLRVIAKGEEITSDTSTLENESVILQLQGKA